MVGDGGGGARGSVGTRERGARVDDKGGGCCHQRAIDRNWGCTCSRPLRRDQGVADPLCLRGSSRIAPFSFVRCLSYCKGIKKLDY